MIWNFDPQIFSFFTLRWYGLLFVIGFVFGYYIFRRILIQQNYKDYDEICNKFIFYAVIGTAVGARLGHVFFYQWDYYSQHLLEILYIWKGGLASHGGVIGMIVAVLLFIKQYGKKFKITAWAFFDALIVPALLVSCLIRLGNFCNSEILGVQTKTDNGIVFCGDFYSAIHHLDKSFEKPDLKVERSGEAGEGIMPVVCTLQFDKENEKIASWVFSYVQHYSDNFEFSDARIETQQVGGKWNYSVACQGVLRHPAQLYESMAYLVLFLLSLMFYRKLAPYQGVCLSIFLGAIFLFRFFVEYIKIEQVEAEKDMVLNIGQLLSIPVVIICATLAIWRFVVSRKKKQ